MRTAGLIFALCAALVLSTAATAQEMTGSQKGLYLGLGAGVSLPRDSDISGSGIDASADLETGFGGLGSVGYAYPNNIRTEVELGYWNNGVDSVSGTSGSGDVDIFNGMVNGYYDFPLSNRFRPYIGVGIGGARLGFDGVSPVGGSRIDDADWAFAYQGIAGVGYELNERTSLFADYRYFSTLDADFSTDAGASVEGDYSAHRFVVGIRWFFGVPEKKMEPTPAAAPAPQPEPRVEAPKPPPEPEPQVARNYIVFFDWDRADLKPEALRIIREAATNYPKVQVTRIEATGHADRSGPEGYNMRLSMRRAQAVRDELVSQGVPSDQIAIFAKGETEPLVQTADGVREPQNRRVEIVLQ